MSGRLAGKVALVTGAGGGIGEATARLFWEEGAAVALVDADRAAVDRAARSIDPSGERVLPIGADLAGEHECERAVRLAVERFGGLDVLANIAGVRVFGPVVKATPEEWQHVLDVNLLATAYCSKFAAIEMARKGGGSIVNVSSANAIVGRSNMGPYDASKAAVLALTRSLASEHVADKIRVNAVCPGPVLTSYHIRRRAARNQTSLEGAEAAMRQAGTSNLMKRFGEPREIACSILFLASDEASYVTGATFIIDGGLSI